MCLSHYVVGNGVWLTHLGVSTLKCVWPTHLGVIFSLQGRCWGVGSSVEGPLHWGVLSPLQGGYRGVFIPLCGGYWGVPNSLVCIWCDFPLQSDYWGVVIPLLDGC